MYEIGGLHDNTKYQFADLKSTIPMECTKTRVESSQLSHLQTGSFLLKTYPFHCLGVYSRKTPLQKVFHLQENLQENQYILQCISVSIKYSSF